MAHRTRGRKEHLLLPQILCLFADGLSIPLTISDFMLQRALKIAHWVSQLSIIQCQCVPILIILSLFYFVPPLPHTRIRAACLSICCPIPGHVHIGDITYWATWFQVLVINSVLCVCFFLLPSPVEVCQRASIFQILLGTPDFGFIRNKMSCWLSEGMHILERQSVHRTRRLLIQNPGHTWAGPSWIEW